MTREEFHRELKSGLVRSCYLFEGEEEYTKRAALETLRGIVLSDGFAELNETVLTNPADDVLIAQAETLPMMAAKRLVVVRESSQLASKSGANAQEESDAPAPAGELSTYVANLPETVCLVFYVQGKANATRRLFKQINKLGGRVSFDALDQRTLFRWMEREFGRGGKAVEQETMEQLVFAVGSDMHILSNEMQKLIAFAGEAERITSAHIDAIATRSTEYRVFDLSDALASGKAKQCAALMEAMLREGEQRLMLLALLQRQYRQMLFAKVLSQEKTSADGMAKALGVPPFVARRLAAQVERLSREAIEADYVLLIDTEYAVKSGQMMEDGCLEQAVYTILSRRGKH